jgi:hypothetical protein
MQFAPSLSLYFKVQKKLLYFAAGPGAMELPR